MKLAAARRILTLDFGSHTIKLGEFQKSATGGLTMLNYGVRAMDHHDPKNRLSCIIKTIKALLEETRIRPASVIVGVSESFMRFIKLPAVLEELSMKKIMEFEAKQHIPSLLEEVVWDYRILSNGEEKEAVIVAVKKDFLEEIQAALAHLKMNILSIEITPWSLAETFHFNYPDSKDCSLLIDIGDKTTHLTFTENKKVFCRALPSAGHTLAKQIAKECHKSQDEAEELKKTSASLSKHLESAASSDKEHVSKIAKNFFSQLHVEISQTIHIYCEQHRGSMPKTVFITGGTSLVHEADSFLKKKLSLPVESLNPFKRVAVASLLNQTRAAKDAPFLASLVGLALEKEASFDLRPPSVRKKIEEKKRRPWLVGALTLWMIAFLIPVTAHIGMYKKVSSEFKQRQTILRQSESLWEQIQTKEKKFSKNVEMLSLCENFAKQRAFWSELFNELNSCVPDDIWITSLKLEKNVLHIKGLVEAHPNALNQISLFKKVLLEGIFFKDIQSKQTELNLTSPNKDESRLVLSFELEGVLKPEKIVSP